MVGWGAESGEVSKEGSVLTRERTHDTLKSHAERRHAEERDGFVYTKRVSCFAGL